MGAGFIPRPVQPWLREKAPKGLDRDLKLIDGHGRRIGTGADALAATRLHFDGRLGIERRESRRDGRGDGVLDRLFRFRAFDALEIGGELYGDRRSIADSIY